MAGCNLEFTHYAGVTNSERLGCGTAFDGGQGNLVYLLDSKTLFKRHLWR